MTGSGSAKAEGLGVISNSRRYFGPLVLCGFLGNASDRK